MQRIIWTHQSTQPFYVFDATHIVHFWDDGLSIHRAGKCYEDVDTRLSPFEGPHIYPKSLPLDFYKSAVLNQRLPLTVVMEGDNLGAVKHTAGYTLGEPEIGAYRRRIQRQRTKLWIADGSLGLRLKIEASPVDPRTTLGKLRSEDKVAKTYRFEFSFPLAIVPELFDLTDSERRLFEQKYGTAQA
jgi:hypothetical protein